MKSFFVFDVESVGLHGEAFAVGGGVYLENGAVQWEFCFNVDPNVCNGTISDRKWVNENVPAMEATHRSAVRMRDAFWEQWKKAKAGHPNIVMAAECGWPVEARFLCACVNDAPEERNWEGPYPLHEIATFMVAAGMDPMAKYERTPSEMPQHNPLTDARLSARLLSEAISKIKAKSPDPIWDARNSQEPAV